MSPQRRLIFEHRPSTLAYMLRALYPPQLRKAGSFPPVCATWRQHRVDMRHLGEFVALTGMGADHGLPLLYPHVFGFPLQMAILTHPALPVPIWNSLQIRNHLLQHRPIPVAAVLDLETRVVSQRVVEKGAEIDLHTSVCVRNELLWESLNTFYYRGRFGEAGPASARAGAPEARGQKLAQWHMATGPGWRFSGLTGDYNGIHWSRRYARLFGFRQAFHHPQLVLGQCMARLPVLDPARPQRLDAWLKGPVYYDSDVQLRAAAEPGGNAFAVFAADEPRAAIIGRWRLTGAGEDPLN